MSELRPSSWSAAEWCTARNHYYKAAPCTSTAAHLSQRLNRSLTLHRWTNPASKHLAGPSSSPAKTDK